MKRLTLYIIFFSLIVATTSCKHEHIPDNLIDTATMTAILTEYYLIDGYDYAIASRYPDSLGYQSKAAKDSLLSKYNISQSDLDSSLLYYAHHPKVFETVMNRAINAIDRLNKDLMSKN